MTHNQYQVSMEIAGPTAIWTRPDSGDAPCSYPAPTYSAVRSIFESILWLPAVQIVPWKIEICSPIQYHSYVTNYGGPLRKLDSIKRGNNYQLYATVLVDVCYRLYAYVMPYYDKANLPQTAVVWDSRTTSPGHAYQDIFQRRLKRGQSFASLFLGWKEFSPSYFGLFRDSTEVCRELPDIQIPSMLRETFPDGLNSKYRAVYDTNLCIHQGILIFPERRSTQL